MKPRRKKPSVKAPALEARRLPGRVYTPSVEGFGQIVKTCPKCLEEKPLEGFRKDKGRALGVDGICKKCRRAETQANRERENKRWSENRKKRTREGTWKPKDPVKVNARAAARRHVPKPEQCGMKGCTERAERHHYMGYEREQWTKVMPLCRKHHAAQHVLERARQRTGPSYL